MARSELFSRKQPGGVYTIANWRDLPKDGWFVDSAATNGSDAVGYGRNPDAAFKTLDYAFAHATAGDKVYVAPWHAENLTTATSVNADAAGVIVEGVRMGNLMPTFTATAAAGSITVAAANVTLRNLNLVAGFAGGCAAALTIPATATGCTLEGIVCRDSTNNLEWLLHVTVAASVTDLTIKDCSFVGLIGGTMTNSILFAGATTNTIIEDSYIFVDSSDDVIDHLAGASINLVVRRNVIINHDADAAGYCLRYKSDGTGVAHHNLMGYREVNAEVGIAGDAEYMAF
jgi:hypothetical protein